MSDSIISQSSFPGNPQFPYLIGENTKQINILWDYNPFFLVLDHVFLFFSPNRKLHSRSEKQKLQAQKHNIIFGPRTTL